jgi:hypothetical protein
MHCWECTRAASFIRVRCFIHNSSPPFIPETTGLVEEPCQFFGIICPRSEQSALECWNLEGVAESVEVLLRQFGMHLEQFGIATARVDFSGQILCQQPGPLDQQFSRRD